MVKEEESRQGGEAAVSDASSEIDLMGTSHGTIYTPSSSGTIADEESIAEREPLLSEKVPPGYEDVIQEPFSLKKDRIIDDSQEDRCHRGNRPGRYRRCARSKVRRAFIFLKITIFLGLLSYFAATLCLRLKACSTTSITVC